MRVDVPNVDSEKGSQEVEVVSCDGAMIVWTKRECHTKRIVKSSDHH